MYDYYYIIWYNEPDPFKEMVSNGKRYDDFVTIPRKICSIIFRYILKLLKPQFKTDM